MKITRSDLAHCADVHGAVVMIDVLRSFTTAACALAWGARDLVAVASIDEARAVRASEPEVLAVGAVGGGHPIPGFDLGNSPSALARYPIAGRRVLLYTAGGTRGLVECAHAGAMLAAGLVNAAATARFVRALAPPSVSLVVTGNWSDRDGDEDHACADLIEALLAGRDPPRAPFARRVRESDFGRRFAADTDPDLPAADLDWCAAADRFDFAMGIEPCAQGRRIRALRPDAAAHLRKRDA